MVPENSVTYHLLAKYTGITYLQSDTRSPKFRLKPIILCRQVDRRFLLHLQMKVSAFQANRFPGLLTWLLPSDEVFTEPPSSFFRPLRHKSCCTPVRLALWAFTIFSFHHSTILNFEHVRKTFFISQLLYFNGHFS